MSLCVAETGKPLGIDQMVTNRSLIPYKCLHSIEVISIISNEFIGVLTKFNAVRLQSDTYAKLNKEN